MKVHAGLAAAFVLICPTRPFGAEAPPAHGFEWWRLRSGDVTTTGAVPHERGVAGNGPDGRPPERRAVRVVYPGLTSGPGFTARP